MTEPIWINLRVVKVFHDLQINEHCGLQGLRDEGLLLCALYQGPKMPIITLIQNQTWQNALLPTGLVSRKIIHSMMLINELH